ncbi:MAG: transcriptional repressor [Paludibacteraceae bacterium]|nr:transcriptional repressor [Paludibacteraceae bacterium]
MEQTKDYLSSHGIRPSAQRMAIMDYLLKHKTHPSVEEIYSALLPSLPTLSKTTLYNTLKLFSDKKVALMLNIDEHTTRFDGDVKPHAHFQCQVCGGVYDIFEDELPELTSLYKEQIGELEISSVEISYRGVCAKCANKND